MGYLMPKVYLLWNIRDTIQSIAGGNKGIHTFTKGIYPKVYITVPQEF